MSPSTQTLGSEGSSLAVASREWNDHFVCWQSMTKVQFMKNSETAPIFGWNEKRWHFSWNVMNCDDEDSPFTFFLFFCSSSLHLHTVKRTSQPRFRRFAWPLPVFFPGRFDNLRIDGKTAKVWSPPAAGGGASVRFAIWCCFGCWFEAWN